ncbi:MAG: hypothetical protein AMS27_12480, partial [Bacteroides sp. SM23_62_1]
GWTNHTDPTGGGGLGGAGVIWHSLEDNLPVNVTKKIENGKPGQHIIYGTRGAIGSSSPKGVIIPNLKIPISGFLFNVMPEDQDVCEGVEPVPFYASKPKGGTWEYTYKWLRSPDKTTWSDAPGKNDSIYYVPGLLNDTTYFRRIVYSGLTVDTSLILTINILPILENNNIAPDDTICKGSFIPDLKDDPFFNIIGGDGTYTFEWESRTDTSAWASTGITDTILRSIKQYETTYYRRVVRSHVCKLISDSLTITVLDSIHNNFISPDDIICENDDGQPITGQAVTGGDGTYTYFWQSSMDSATWDYAKAPHTLPDYDPDTLVTTRYYRRLVYSGSEDVCKDTSNIIKILVHPLITNNIIARDTTICADDPGLILIQQSGTVGGGDGVNYAYEWQSKPQGGIWGQAGKTDTLVNYETGYLTDTITFRRYMTSGACSDISNEVVVILQDSILNNLIADHDTICQGSIPNALTGQSPVGGDGIYAYLWQKKTNITDWEDITGATLAGYAPPSLVDTTYYRRKVTSGKCFHFSEFKTVIVQAPIANNVIKNGSTDEACYETSLLLDGTSGPSEVSGGDEAEYIYNWEKSPDNINWNPAPGTIDQADYTTEDLLLPAYFRRNIESGACTDISASTYVSINQRPTGEFINNDYPALCYDADIGPVEIQIQYKLTGTPPYRMIYNDGFENDTLENILLGENSFSHYVTTIDTNLYEIVITALTDANGCIAYSDSLTGMVTAVLYRRPGAVILIDGDTVQVDTVQVCDDCILLGSQQDVGYGYWEKVSGDENLSIDDSSSIIILACTDFDSKNSQYYKLYRTNINWPVNGGENCFARDSIEVILWQEPDPAYAGSRPAEEYDTTIYFADYMFLYADPPTAGSGEWTLLSGMALIDNDTLYNSFVDLGDQNLDETVEYVFHWTISNGICPVTSDELRITRRDLRIYEGFSPDGDGINDFYVIEGLDYTDAYDFKIFTRSGNLIRRIHKGPGGEGLSGDHLWDGTYDGGRPVETGIYFYTLEVKKGDRDTYHYHGSIILTRGN